MKRNSLVALALILASFASVFLLPKLSWNAGVWLLHALQNGWVFWWAGFALATGLLRKYLLKQPAFFGLAAGLYLVLFCLAFASMFWPPEIRPMLWLLWAFWHAALLLGVLALNLLETALEKLRNQAAARPWLAFLIITLALGGFWALLAPTLHRGVENLAARFWFWLVLLLPWASVAWRRRLFKKPARYLAGFFLVFLAMGLGARPGAGTHGVLLLALYAALWLHVFSEEFTAWALRWVSPRRFQTLWSGWLAHFKAPGAKPGAAHTPGFRLPWLGHLDLSRVKTFYQAHRQILLITAVALLALGVLLPVVRVLYRVFLVDVVEFTPSGEVNDRTTLRVTFSDPVRVTGDINRLDCLTLTPALAGSYRLATDKTLIFLPNEPLKPSTEYTAEFSPNHQITGVRKRLLARARTHFNTPRFKVANSNIFYNVDAISGEDIGVVGQLDFNYPVSPADLRKNTEMQLEGKALPFEIEKSLSHTRYYLKVAAIKPQDKDQTVVLSVSRNLNCANGTLPLASNFSRDLKLPSKPKLEVTEVKLWHEPGTTLVSVLFNLPISQSEVKRCVHLDPEMPFTVETEYAYAVLRGHYQPNTTYTVKIDKGLKARTGQVLETAAEQSVEITDLPPQVKFAREGNLLSLNGPKTLEIKTLNLDEVRVHIQKIFRNNLVEFLNNPEYPQRAREIYDDTYRVEDGQINEELSQYLNLAKFHHEPYKGLFKIDLSDPKTYENRASAWFLCTDLGLVAKHAGDDLVVYALSLESLQSRAGVELDLVSADNQVMDHQATDESGRAVFTNWKNNEYKLAPALLVAKSGDDFSFLEFSKSELNQYQFSIGGDPHDRKNLSAFLTPERGVYRPGETVHLTAVVRQADNTLPPQLPLRLEVRDPRNSVVKQLTVRTNANGVAVVDLALGGDALTGQYQARLRALEKEDPIGLAAFKVEEFIPDKIKVEVKTPAGPLGAKQPLAFSVRARQLFGPPAAKAKVVTSVRFYSRIFSAPDFADYTFADEASSFQDQEVDLGQSQLDEEGAKAYALELPLMTPPSALKAYIYSEVFDSGGRPVSAAGYMDVDPYPHYLGLKLDGQAPYLTKAGLRFRYVAVSPAGKPLDAGKARLVIKRKAWYSIFRSSGWGRSGYQSAAYEELVLNREIDIQGKGTYAFTPDKEGEYRILLISPGGMRTSLAVNVVGTGFDVASLESPEKLKLVLDKKSYAVGDEAKVFVRSPFPGKLFLTVEREKVFETRVVEMTGRETTVSVPVSAEYLPNVYVVGLAVRRPDPSLQTLPMVSFGVEPLAVKTDSKRLELTWDIPKAVQSAGGIDAAVTLHGGEKTSVVLAAVDEGILQITGFATPDPLEYFYRKRSLTTLSYTILNLLLPDVVAKKFAVGGGDSGEFTRRHLNPVQAKKKKSLALVSGVLTPDAEGRVRYHFPTRGFNGEVRVMALAASGDRYGSAGKAVTVADPLVLIPNFPRFLAPADAFQVPVEVYNKLGQDAKVTVRLTASGPARVTDASPAQTFLLKKEEQKRLLFMAEALDNAGVAKLRVSARSDAYESAQEEEVSVRPGTTLVTTGAEGRLNPGATVNLSVPGGFIPFGQRVRLSVSGNPLFQYLGVLDALIAYPYGCAEQVTSQIFPLLYFKDLGFATGRFAQRANAVDEYVQAGIRTLEKQQLDDGEFALWPGGESGGRWLNMYVAHFLLEAQGHGYAVDPKVMERVRQFITAGKTSGEDKHASRLDRRGVDENKPPLEPYMLYLKALLGEPDREGMNFILTKELKNLPELDRALFSLAYAQIGDNATAEKILTPDFKSRFAYREQYGSFNSPVRNTAAYLAALAAANPKSPRVQPLVAYLTGQMRQGSLGNTQENAWMLMALAKVFGESNQPVKTEILSEGQPYKTLDGRDLNFTDPALSGKKLTLKNTGAGESYYYLLAEGTPAGKRAPRTSQGLTLERTYRDAEGRELNLTNVPQGSLAVVTLRVRATREAVHNLVLIDLLPAGFEIENPRLSSRGQLEFDPETGLSPNYQDIRDDRILIFCDTVEGAQSFSYSVRAVTPGHFSIPNCLAETLYDPAIKAEYGETKSLVVVENNGQ
jgi:alpha-2-macroglobulin